VRNTLVRVLADEHIVVTQLGEPVLSTPSALHQDVMQAIEKVTAELWPGIPVVPVMSTGGTDGSHLRNAGIPTYGTSGVASEEIRAHGRDERVLVKSFLDANQYLCRLVKLLAGGQGGGTSRTLAQSHHPERNGAAGRVSAISSLIQSKFRLGQRAQRLRPRVFAQWSNGIYASHSAVSLRGRRMWECLLCTMGNRSVHLGTRSRHGYRRCGAGVMKLGRSKLHVGIVTAS